MRLRISCFWRGLIVSWADHLVMEQVVNRREGLALEQRGGTNQRQQHVTHDDAAGQLLPNDAALNGQVDRVGATVDGPVFRVDPQAQVRMALKEIVKVRDEYFASRPRGHRHAQLGAAVLLEEASGSSSKGMQRLVRHVQVGPSRTRQGDSPSLADEQIHAERFFDRADLMADS